MNNQVLIPVFTLSLSSLISVVKPLLTRAGTRSYVTSTLLSILFVINAVNRYWQILRCSQAPLLLEALLQHFPPFLPVVQWLYYGTRTKRFVASRSPQCDLVEVKEVLSHQITNLLLLARNKQTNKQTN